MYDILISDISILTPEYTIKEHQTLAVEGGRFVKIADSDIFFAESADAETAAANTAAETAVSATAAKTFLDGRGLLLMPGLADCHMHTGQQLLKGNILDELPMIWTRIMLPFESTLTPEKMELSASLAALEMIRSGTTAFLDAGSYHMDAAAEIYARSGLRATLSLSTMDEPGLPESIACTTEQAVRQSDEFYDRWNGKGLIRTAYALRSLISCSEELIAKIAAHARERGALLQAHMNEYPNEVEFFLKKKKLRPVEYLDSLGVLDSKFISAHSLLLSESEKELLRKRGAFVCHCPFSNCGKGLPDTPGLLSRGLTVGLGTDGAAHGGLSLWNEMKIFRSIMNLGYGVPQKNPAIMPAKTILKMASENGYCLLNEPEGGRITVGAKADFITINRKAPHLYPTGNLVNTLVESVAGADVKDMAVDGKWIMKDREILTLDEEKILFQAMAHSGLR